MSEKRFELQHINDLTDKEYMRLKKITDNGELITLGEVVDLLNEQQATINKLQEELELTANTKLFSRRKLEEENEHLRQELEQIKKVKRKID